MRGGGMKKALSVLLALCLCTVSAFMFGACNNTRDGGYMPPPEEGENAPDEDTPAADIRRARSERKTDDSPLECRQHSRL